jgi:hypothetical protein
MFPHPPPKVEPAKHRACQRKFSGLPISILKTHEKIFNISGKESVIIRLRILTGITHVAPNQTENK